MSRFFGGRRREGEEAAPQPPAFGAAQQPPPPREASGAAGSARLYSPYAGLSGSFDPAISRVLLECVARRGSAARPTHPSRRLPPSPEFLFSEEALVHQRTWSENLTFVTGVSYLGGAAAGGAIGCAAGARVPLPVGAEGWKMRLNRVLNHGGKQGRLMGNSGGVAGLLFSSLDSGLSAARGGRRDAAGTVAVAAATGALFKAPQGARAAAVWSAGGALLGGFYAAGSAAAERLLH